jgi:hypothetical protein
MHYDTVLGKYKKRGVSLNVLKCGRRINSQTWMFLNQSLVNTKTGTSRTLDQAQSLPQVAEHA